MNLLWDLRGGCLHTCLGLSRRRFNWELDDHSVAALKSLKIRKWECLYLLENPRKKESVVPELARGRVSKFLLVGSYRMLVVQVTIVKLRFFHSGFRFILRIARLNPLQVFTGVVSWVIISLCSLFSALYIDMIIWLCVNLDLKFGLSNHLANYLG